MSNIDQEDVMTTEEIFEELKDDIFYDTMSVQSLAEHIHKLNKQWWQFDLAGPTRNKGEAIALMHSELSECLEGVRKNKKDEHLPELDNEVVELADCVIRILDYCMGFKLPIGKAIHDKLHYNAHRSDHKKHIREKQGGKKF